MSTEAQMEKDEVKVIEREKSVKQILKEYWPVGIKILELVSNVENFNKMFCIQF